jgi:ribosomal-protein-alanine N-acetyltransferase
MRPLEVDDFSEWQVVRRRNADWLTAWEPRRGFGQPDPAVDRQAFAMRCAARRRERQLGTGWGFGVFVGVDGTDHFAGEVNLSNVVRGAFRSAHIGYWMDEDRAGNGYIPEALVMACRFAFEEIDLHRVQVSIVPRNTRSRRVVEKLEFRCEGLAERYLEIDGVWEDHLRFAITAEEWCLRRTVLAATWLKPSGN